MYGKPCECRNKGQADRSLSFASIPEKYKFVRFSNFNPGIYVKKESFESIKTVKAAMLEYLTNFEEMSENGKGLYISSETKGSGKTRIAASLANELLHEKGIRVKFATSTTIIQEITNTWNNKKLNEGKLLRDLAAAKVLIIDDFGTEEYHSWIEEKFYQIINERYCSKKVTIYTSNLKLHELAYGDRITSRIRETAYLIDFPEEDVRHLIGFDDDMKLLDRMGGDLS